jgi:hypothetical protein
MIWQTDLASFLLDHLTFMEEQLSGAKTNSADQFAAIDAAKSAFVLIQARLEQQDPTLAAQYTLLFDPYSPSHHKWTETAKLEPSEFLSEIDKLLGVIKTAKTVPQSK